jgi:small subunit ribosomal protein S6
MAKAKVAAAAKIYQYEAMFLIGANVSADVEASLKLVRGIVERHEGKIQVIKKWDERKLAYEIRGQKRGLYVICFFQAPGAAVAGIERDVNLSDQIVRVLVTTADHLTPEEMAAVEPQPIIPREERNSWDRPYEDRGPSRDREHGDRPPRRREEHAESAKE